VTDINTLRNTCRPQPWHLAWVHLFMKLRTLNLI